MRHGLFCAKTLAVWTAGVILISGCGGGSDNSAPSEIRPTAKALAMGRVQEAGPVLNVAVLSLTKVGEKRISRTVYEYVFRISIKNSGSAYTGFVSSILSAGQGTTVLDGQVNVGDISADAVVMPADTVMLRHDRTIAFRPEALVWTFVGVPVAEIINGIVVPPLPNPALNQSTLAGVDTNRDGIRDDIERLIAQKFWQDKDSLVLIRLNMKTLQSALVSPSVDTVQASINTFRCTRDDALLTKLDEVARAVLDTPLRRGTYGKVFAGVEINREGC